MTRYHFDLGNSNTGPIGFCAAVYADSAEEAALLLNTAIRELGHSHNVIDNDAEDDEPEPYIDYLGVYFNPVKGVAVTDIDEEDDGVPLTE